MNSKQDVTRQEDGPLRRSVRILSPAGCMEAGHGSRRWKKGSPLDRMNARALKAGLIPLFLPVPPMFERSVGYRGESRLVAFYWDSCEELCFLDDSLATGTIDAAGWQIFVGHPFVRRHLRPYDLGSGEFAARHWLLLDRRERRFHIGAREDVETFLEGEARPDCRAALPRQGETTVTLDQFITMAGTIEEVLSQEFFPDEMMRRLTEQQAVCVELREWLDGLG